ncbi:hypothetical protein LWI29_036764 [Acer saccharum]|uniref:Ubiquitin-like protease family profile domain-containing protein n=2 Tax=Acer saccharum TaxID=4024 RepID=A0AA39RTJ4_ACESA|nr:hypothetical protein LWI29_036764 [Acer saccharum]
MFCAPYMQMALFPWKVSAHEKSSAYYKSLMLQDDAEERENAIEEGDASIHQSKTTTRFIGSRKSDEPSSKKRLFDDGDVETPKSKIKTSVPYTIPELYTSIEQLVTQKIKESEDRMKSWISEEIGKIAPEKREKDLDERRASSHKPWSHKPVDDMVSPNLSPLHNFNDGEKLEKDLNKEDVEEVERAKVEKAEVEMAEVEKAEVEKAEDKDDTGMAEVEKAEVEMAEVEKADDKDDTGIVVGKEGGLDNVVGESYGSAKHAINLDDFPSPCVNVVLPNPDLSVIFMNAADPSVCYKNNENVRARRRSKYLDSPYTDPMPIPKKRKRTKDLSDCVNDNYDRFISFLKNKDDTRVFTGQPVDMNREQFNNLVKPTKWLSNLHIDSYLDVLWKRRRSNGEVSDCQEIGLVPTAFFAHLKLKWEAVKKLLESEHLKNNNPAGFEQKEVKKNKKKKKDVTPTTPAVPIWEEYPEFDPLSFQPDDDTLNYVSGSDLLYPQPWWTMESVLVPCNTGDHWVLCEVLLKEGKVNLYDSLCDRNGKSDRLKDIPGLLYLLPSILKHSGYYEHMKMPPHTSPFTAENIEPTILPQQDDGYSCGAFVCKYAELILFGFPLSSWMEMFGQKDIPTIRQAIALEIFVNGELC